MRNTYSYAILILLALLTTSCNKINLLTLEDERQLGAQTKQQILNDPSFNVMARSTNPQAYALLESMKDQILASGQVKYKDDFVWDINIIKDDATLNAFCTPGGYIFFYTGLMKYLDNSSAVAGVMGHEMAHADKRHSGKQMTSQMGLEVLLAIVTGQTGSQVGQMVGLLTQLGSLHYSRAAETEADENSVKYLCPTQYQSDGAHYFFKKLVDEGNSQGPAIFSTHPDPVDRVADILSTAAATTGCTSVKKPYANDTEYLNLRSTL